MGKQYFLLTPSVMDKLDSRVELSQTLIAGWQLLWHPAYLAVSDELPIMCSMLEVPVGTPTRVVIPTALFNSIPSLQQTDLRAWIESANATLIQLDVEGTTNPAAATGQAPEPGKAVESTPLERVLALTGDSSMSVPIDHEARDLLASYYAFAYTWLGLKVLAQHMNQPDPVDENNLEPKVISSAKAFQAGDFEQCRADLRHAFEQLNDARQFLYSATIHWVDMQLLPPKFADLETFRKVRDQYPWNLLVTGEDLSHWQSQAPELIEWLRADLQNQQLDILVGGYRDLDWHRAAMTSQYFQLAETARVYESAFGRPAEMFGSRQLMLSPELPRMLSKVDFRQALHAAFDGSYFPTFRDARIHWTSADGSMIDSMSRVIRNGGDHRIGLSIFKYLADSLLHDYSASLLITHWINQQADWLYWYRVSAQWSHVLGKFASFSEFFLHASYPNTRTKTNALDYEPSYLIGKTPKPIGPAMIAYRNARALLDGCTSLQALAQVLSPKQSVDGSLADDERQLECSSDLAVHEQISARVRASLPVVLKQLVDEIASPVNRLTA